MLEQKKIEDKFVLTPEQRVALIEAKIARAQVRMKVLAEQAQVLARAGLRK